MKLLIKRAFKSIFRNKFFMALMFILVALSGATFTVLDSSANSFKQSYNNVVVEGNLHDAVIKENFKVESGSTLELGMYDYQGNVVDINEVNLAKALQDAEDANDSNKYFVSGSNYKIQLGTLGQPTGSYKNIILNNTFANFTKNADNSFSDEVAQIQDFATDTKAELIADTEARLSDQFTDVVNQIYGVSGTNELIAQNTKSLSVTSTNAQTGKENAFKLVRTSTDDKVNQMVMNDGTNLFTKSRSEANMINEINDQILNRGLSVDDYTFNTLKGYKVMASSFAETIDVFDPSAFQAIVSPAYANANGKKSITPQELVDLYYYGSNLDHNKPDSSHSFYKDISENSQKGEALREKYKDNLVWVDQTPYFIIGIGTRPDFSYPIIDEQHPTVDVDNQAVLFVNDRGYDRALDAWRTNPKEDYISIKYNSNVSQQRRSEIDKELQELILHGKSAVITNQDVASELSSVISSGINIPTSFFPSNIDVVTTADDPNDVMLLVQERTSVLNTLQGTITSLSRATTFLLVIFVASIVILVFNVLISINRKSLATLMALGYSRSKIAFSTAFISLAIGLLPTIIGYLAGFGSQYAFINSFDQFWTLPAYGDPFSWMSLVIVVGVPFLLLGLLIFVIVLGALRYSVPMMLKDSVKEENPYTAKVVSKFRFMGPKGRYSVALMFKNSGKLVLVGLTMSISLISLMVGFSTSGAAAQAYNATSQMNKYDYRIDLFSPTVEGGEYNLLTRSDNGKLITMNPIAETYGGGITLSEPHWHVPGLTDANYGLPDQALNHLAGSATYLENMLQVKALLDTEVGGLKPWEIASRLMPENQLNTANEDAIDFESFMSQSPKRLNESDQAYMIRRFTDYLRSEDGIPYIISYKSVITDPGDNTYTYIDSSFNMNNSSYKYYITGLSDNHGTEDINIAQTQIDDLNSFATSNQNTLPILINRYMSEYLGLNAGDSFEVTINNDANRNFKNHQTHKVNVVVRGVVDGYDDGGIYTTQSIANGLLGLSPTAFNGVYSNNENSSLLNTLPLYSPSGLYLGTDTIIGDWEPVLDAILKDSTIWEFGNPTEADFIADSVDDFVRLYSRTPFVSSTSSVHWQALNKATFKNTSDLTNTMIWLVEGISISISIIFMSIVSLLLFVSNRKKIATLWTLGYRRREITKIFLGTYILPFIISIAIAIPASMGILFGLRAFIMGFGHILIPLSLTIWAPFVAILVVATIFVAATILSVLSQRPDKNLAAFKE